MNLEVTMKPCLSSNIWWQSFMFLVCISLILIACGGGSADSTVPEGCDGVTWGSSIQVEEREDEYYVIVEGNYPDSCSTVCGSEQMVDGNEININLYSSRPEDMVCSQMLTPFLEEVPLDTEGLDPGEYTLTLNETHATTTFILR